MTEKKSEKSQIMFIFILSFSFYCLLNYSFVIFYTYDEYDDMMMNGMFYKNQSITWNLKGVSNTYI